MSAPGEHETRELYVELGTILKHKRAPEIEQAVNEIIQSDAPIAEKLAKIKALDEKPFKSKLHYLRRDGHDEAPEQHIEIRHDELSARGIYTSVFVKEKRRRLKLSPKRSGFFEFFFKDHPRLREFQDRTGVIECSIIPPSVRPGRRIEKQFVDAVFMPAKDLLKPLMTVEANGWTVLTKTEYNLVIEFKRLVERIISLSAESNRDGEIGFFPKLRRLELQFLICHGRHEWPDMMIAAVERTLRAVKTDMNIAQITAAIRTVLMPRLNGPSLYAMIIALTVVDKRRMIELDDIVDRAGSIISNYNFECPAAVQDAISARVESLVSSLTLLAAERRSVLAVNAFVRKSADSYDFTVLRDCIAANGHTEPMTVYASNMILFAAHFARAFALQFEALLCGTLPLAAGARVFSEDCFRHVFTDLLHHADTLERLARVDQHIVISRERFSGMADASVSGTALRTTGEIEVLQAITRLSSMISSIGEDIAAAARGQAGTDAKPIELIDVKRGACIIPHAEERLGQCGMLSGGTVSAALITAACVCHTAAVFMHDHRICSLLAREVTVHEEIRRVKNEIERLAAAPVYESIKGIDA